MNAEELPKLSRQERDRARYLRVREQRLAQMKEYYIANRSARIEYQRAYQQRRRVGNTTESHSEAN